MLLTCAIVTVKTDVSLYRWSQLISQTQRLQYIAVIWLVWYHVAFNHLSSKHDISL